MDKIKFIKLLKSDSKLLEHRTLLVDAVLQNHDWVSILLNDVANINDKQSNFSARILELVCKRGNLELIIPYLDKFSALVPKIKYEGVIRSSAKIIELLTVVYFIKVNSVYRTHLKAIHLEQFTETCFDWMLTDKSIAIQAHSMYSLYLLGTQYNWIHPELTQIIERNLPNSSMGYKNRGEKIIKAIHSNKVFKL